MAGTRQLLLQTDWSATALGAMDQWPASMRNVVEMALSSGFPVATVWGDEAIQIYNDAYLPIYGSKHPGAFGRPMRESWAEIWDFLYPSFEQVMATGEPVWFRDSLLPIACSGTPQEFWFDFSYSIVRDDQGRGVGMISIAVDKTREVVLGRRQTCCELAIEPSREDRLHALGEALRSRLADNPMDAAAAEFRIVGTSNDAEVAALWKIGDDPAPAEDPRWQRLVIADLKGQTVARLDLVASPLVPAESHAVFVTMLSDRLHRVLHQAELLERAKDALVQQDKLYQFLFENIGEAAIYSATDGGRDSEEVILAANAAADKMLGFGPGGLVGMKRDELFFPESLELREALAVRETNRNFSGELLFRRMDGQPLRIEASSRLVQTQEGDFRAVSLLRDVSMRAQREAERAAQSRFEAIAQLTGGMAHDFNNLLTVVLGSLEMLLDDLPAGSRAAAYASNALLCAERGASLTSQLLSYSRQQTLKLQRVDMGAHVEDLAPLLRSSLGELNRLCIQRDGPIPPCASDLSQLTTALLGLASNAREAMPDGGTLTLATDLVELPTTQAAWPLPPGRYVRLTVADTGPGIPRELHERLFEPYFTTKGMGSGAGLGLSMVKGFMKQCGGDIRVDGSAGEGARFELLFPVDETIRSRPTPRDRPLPSGRGESILVVDDNELVRGQVCGLLEGSGFRVRQAANAREALESVAADGLPSLVLSDLLMPGGMTGMQLAHQLRGDHPDLPVVIMTGHDPWAAGRDEQDRQFDVLAKPFDRATLLGVLARHLG